MTKADLAGKVEGIGFSRKESIMLVESILDIIKDTLEAGEDVKIAGFGKFEVRKKSDRKGRNPHTGEGIVIVGRKVLSFKSSPVLKGIINS
ncbi:MAG: integration host factor subunit alpha [Syntrophales bacterium LBB04]|nr:integration host factor subunit alpha [Syntrophales bacterium LBB04]